MYIFLPLMMAAIVSGTILPYYSCDRPASSVGWQGSFISSPRIIIPVGIHIVETNSTVAASAQLSFSHNHRIRRTEHFATSIPPPPLHVDYIIVGEDLRIPFFLELRQNDLTNFSLTIGASFNSTLARIVGHYLIVPDNQRGGHMVFSPPNPTDYVFGGYVVYSRVFVNREEHVEITSVSLRFPNNTVVESGLFANQPPGIIFPAPLRRSVLFTFIPDDLWNVFVHSMAQNGYFLTNMIIESRDVDTSIFPSIVFTLPSLDGSLFSIVLEPRHYLDPIDNNRFRVTLASRPREPSYIQLGRNLLQTLVIHVDNDRIGFGDPLTYF